MGASFLTAKWLIPPKLTPWQKRAAMLLRSRAPKSRDVVWVFSSGTTAAGRIKCVGLPFDALMESARAVNAHLLVTKRDRWALAIPDYHIGGFSLPIRAHLSGSKVFKMGKWSAKPFARRVREKRITLASLVPTQVFDLVATKVKCPPTLRAVVIGGGSLDANLYKRARDLDWPLLPSYGLTETASQVATAALDSLSRPEFPGLTVLPHAQIKIHQQQVFIQCQSLCRWIATADEDGLYTLEEPLRQGWFATEDLAEWKGVQVPGRPQVLNVLGRRDDVVKVFGVLVSLPQVESDLREFARARGEELATGVTVVAESAQREGSRLIAVCEKQDLAARLDGLLKGFNASVNGPYRIHKVQVVSAIPRTALGKIKRSELRHLLES